MRSAQFATKVAVSIAPASYAAPTNGTGVDLFGFDENVIEIVSGAFAGAATAKIQDSADNSTFADVADANLDGVTGNPAAFALAASSVKTIGYVGLKRYVRVILATSTTGNLVSATVIRMVPKTAP